MNVPLSVLTFISILMPVAVDGRSILYSQCLYSLYSYCNFHL